MNNPQEHSSRINNTAHFIWFGDNIPLVYALGVKSALIHGGFDQVILHLERDLSDEPSVKEHLHAHPAFEIRLIEADHFSAAGNELYQMYQQLEDRRAKSNVLRLVVLARWGGIYLDTDVLVLKDLSPFRDAAFFYGNESNRYPHFTEHRPVVYLRVVSYIHGLVRLLLNRTPGGFAIFRLYERIFYYQLPNNCVIGSVPNHPFLNQLFNNMLALDSKTRTKKWQLGVRMFQRTIAEASNEERSALTAHPSPVFNPLGPVISALWFRPGSARYEKRLAFPETALIHWYSTSVRRRSGLEIHKITSDNIDKNLKNRALYKLLKTVKDTHIK